MPNQVSAYVKNAENSTTKWHKHAEPHAENFDHGQKSHAERIHPPRRQFTRFTNQ